MFRLNRLIPFLLLIAALVSFANPGQRRGLPPLVPEELAMKDNPASPGSLAIVLFREEIVNSKDSTETYYLRIKVFTEEGKKRANIEIPFVKGESDVRDIHARTIHPDGHVVDFGGQVIDNLS